jgi:predicted nuclease of predicted toxin-antitoxin system
MHILANENIPVPSIRKVRSAGITLNAMIEESPGATDVEVLSRAARDDLVIWTFDRDYGDLIFRQGLPTPKGVLYFRFRPSTQHSCCSSWLIRV